MELNRVLIVGFDNYNELDAAMAEVMRDEDCLLFTVVSGYIGKDPPPASLAQQWAINNGAPLEKVVGYNTPEELLKALEWKTDYLVMKMSDQLPRPWKNFMMRFRESGKHGKVFK